jgi:hypothetical protein
MFIKGFTYSLLKFLCQVKRTVKKRKPEQKPLNVKTFANFLGHNSNNHLIIKWQCICSISPKWLMKQFFWYTAISLLINATAGAQTKSKGTNKRQTVSAKSISVNKTKAYRPGNSYSTTTLNSTSGYSAKANTNTLSVVKNNYVVTDPILTTLAARANGANIQFNKSGIIGMPKRAYGFANGHISLTSTGAVTSGTQTGSGAVATGTSLATFGSIGAPMNVNGKSPYAGINMWGNARNMNITKGDSTARLTPIKKQ